MADGQGSFVLFQQVEMVLPPEAKVSLAKEEGAPSGSSKDNLLPRLLWLHLWFLLLGMLGRVLCSLQLLRFSLLLSLSTSEDAWPKKPRQSPWLQQLSEELLSLLFNSHTHRFLKRGQGQFWGDHFSANNTSNTKRCLA